MLETAATLPYFLFVTAGRLPPLSDAVATPLAGVSSLDPGRLALHVRGGFFGAIRRQRPIDRRR